MSALDADELAVLLLALNLLDRQTDTELAQARRKGNSAKQFAMITMRQRIASVRVKLYAMVAS